MKWVYIAAICFTLMLVAPAGYSAGPGETKETALASGEEFSMDIQSDQYRYVVIRYENLSNDNSIVWFTQLKDGKELPENKIGPKFVRTKTLKLKGDQTTVVLASDHTDQIIIHVEKGSLRVGVEQNNSR